MPRNRTTKPAKPVYSDLGSYYVAALEFGHGYARALYGNPSVSNMRYYVSSVETGFRSFTRMHRCPS